MKLTHATTFLALAISIATSLAACSGNDEAAKSSAGAANPTFNFDPKSAAANDPLYQSEISADEGEDLLSPATMSEAQAKFKQALRLNPSNARAGLWGSFLGMQLELQGFIARVKPLFLTLPDGAARYRAFVNKSVDGKSASYRKFYLSGPADIDTPAKFQEWIDRVVLRMTEFREFVDQVKLDDDLSLRAASSIMGDLTNQTSGKKCGGTFGPIVFKPSECDADHLEVSVNSADLDILKSAVVMMQTELVVINAYRLDSSTLIKMLSGGDSNLRADKWISDLQKAGGDGLRPTANTKTSRDGLRDVGLAFQRLRENQTTACPLGHYSQKNRPGFLFATGVCIPAASAKDSETEKTARVMEMLINGDPLDRSVTDKAGPEFQFEWEKFLLNPPAKISDFGPFEYDACNQVVKINDATMNPYFTLGSFNASLQLGKPECTPKSPETAP